MDLSRGDGDGNGPGRNMLEHLESAMEVSQRTEQAEQV